MPLTRQDEQRPRRRPPSKAAPARGPQPELPRDAVQDKGLGADAAYELIESELLLDGQARLNLATFVTTWMPSHAARLMARTADKNMIDKDEYPQTAQIESRCVNMLANLWHCPDESNA